MPEHQSEDARNLSEKISKQDFIANGIYCNGSTSTNASIELFINGNKQNIEWDLFGPQTTLLQVTSYLYISSHYLIQFVVSSEEWTYGN